MTVTPRPPAHRPPAHRARGAMAGRARKAWLTAHVAISVAWLGSAYCMLVLGLTGALATDLSLRIAAYELMHLFDRAVNIPLALGMLGTGLVVSLRTRWGLLRHRWVLVKLVVSVALVTTVPLLSVPRVTGTVDRLRAGLETGPAPVEIVTVSVVAVVALTALTAISIFKPWGRTRRRLRASPVSGPGSPRRGG